MITFYRILELSGLVVLFCPSSAFAKTYTINVDKDECEYYQTHTINQYKTYEIVWHGYAIKGCGVGFYAVGDSIFSFDDYKICVKPVVWDMEDCSSQLYLRYNSVKTIVCTDKKPESLCYEPGVNLDIDVKMHYELAWRVNTTSFTLKVYAKDTTYYGVGLVAACIILWLIIVVVCTHARRRQRSATRHQRRSRSIYSLPGIENLNFITTDGPSPPPYSPNDEHPPPPYSAEDLLKRDNSMSHI